MDRGTRFTVAVMNLAAYSCTEAATTPPSKVSTPHAFVVFIGSRWVRTDDSHILVLGVVDTSVCFA